MSVDNLTALNARDDWLWIVAHWTDLRARLRPGGGNALTGMPTGGSDGHAPISIGVSDLMFEIEDHARFYAQALLEETDDFTFPTESMPGLLHAVVERYGHFTAGDEKTALDFCDTAHEMRRRVEKMLAPPEPATYVGPCQTDNCDGELYVRPGRDCGTCRECGQGFTLVEQREYLDRAMEGRLMTQAEIPRALNILGVKVAPGTVRKWVERERLVEVVDGLYRLADAKALAEGGRRGMVAA